MYTKLIISQQNRVREECKAFAQDENDVGYIPSLRIHMTLKDETPVQKTYMSVRKPLHQEVNEYLQDLINQGWITKSKSAYLSAIVCVRKKSGGLRLCVDYRELKQKSVPDRHPFLGLKKCWTVLLRAHGFLY